MPKENPLTTEIHSLYKRQAVHTLIYGFIQGVQWSLPSVSKKEAAEAFIKRFAGHTDYDAKQVILIYDEVNRDILNKNGKEKPQSAG